MRILITGGAGCLGSNLIEHWLPQGHDILVIDNFATGRPETVPAGVPKLGLIKGSIANRDLVENAFAAFAPTHVVHAAAAYKDPDDWHEDVATNVLGSINVVGAARAAKVRRFINLQTALCYGAPECVPIPVGHPCRPVASYGISKTAGEAYVVNSGLSFVSLRLASIVGPRLTIGAIPTFYQRLKAGKPVFCTTAVRDFLAMSDFLALMDMAMKADAPTGIFNIGPGKGHSIKDVLVAVAAALKLPLPDPIDIRPVGADDIETVVLDASAASAAFQWRAKIGFEDAIADMVRWYDTHGISAIYTHLKAPAGDARI